MNLLFLLGSLRYGGAASRVRCLTQSQDALSPHVAVLGSMARTTGELDLAAQMRRAGASVHALNGRHALDPRPLWSLHRLLRDLDPDPIHVFELSTLRRLALAGGRFLERTLVSRVLLEAPAWTRFDRLLFQKTRGLVASTDWEARSLERQGIPARHIQYVPLRVSPFSSEPEETRGAESLCLDGEANILSLCRLELRHNPRDALWTTDILAYAFPGISLNLIGQGQLAPSLGDIQQNVYFPSRACFIDHVTNVRPYFERAHVCWVTSRPGHGLLTALEAQAAGCPIVAYDQPALREITVLGETALLVPPGDMVALARKTYALFKDADMRTEMSRAAQSRARALLV